MGMYSHFFKSHFKGCPVLHRQEDTGRNRTQTFYYIGEPHLFGIGDRVDCWIAPMACLNKETLEIVQERMKQARDGKLPSEEDEPQPTISRNRISAAPVERKKLITATAPTQIARRHIMKKL